MLEVSSAAIFSPPHQFTKEDVFRGKFGITFSTQSGHAHHFEEGNSKQLIIEEIAVWETRPDN